MEQDRPKKVHVIVNPAPTRKIPLLSILNQQFRDAEIDWDISVTHKQGDGVLRSKRALEEGATMLAAYGGDGTVIEVASALIDTDVPLLILPGGTGNLVASELRIPEKLEQALALVCGVEKVSTRKIDVGMMDDRPFLLRIGAGFESEVVEAATRQLKDQFGKWAYVFAGIKALQQSEEVDYEISLDGEEAFHETGVAFAVANSGTVGVGRLSLSPEMLIDDGLLDVFVLKKANLGAIIQLARQMMGLEKNPLGEVLPWVNASELVTHWTAKTVDVKSDPVMDMQVDGDVVSRTPSKIFVKPSALKVVVAAEAH